VTVGQNRESATYDAVMLTKADFANLCLLEANAPLRRMLETANVVASDAMPPDVVTMNTQVVLQDETSGERRVLRVVFPGDADPSAGLVSVLEPLGLQLLGAAPGQVLECTLGAGMHRFRIEQVLYQPEHSLRTNLVTGR
jgi:regulator of nucleoside diphosphate kinase